MGISPSYVVNINDNERWQHELNLNSYFAYPLMDNFRLGSRIIAIAYSSIITQRALEPAYMVGPILQWHLPVKDKMDFQLEGGYMIGNLCTCGPTDPYPQIGKAIIRSR